MTKRKITFPTSFLKREHLVIKGAFQWVHIKADGHIISIVGGEKGCGLYGNGETTFEMYDKEDEDVKGWLTIDEINKHLDETINTEYNLL